MPQFPLRSLILDAIRQRTALLDYGSLSQVFSDCKHYFELFGKSAKFFSLGVQYVGAADCYEVGLVHRQLPFDGSANQRRVQSGVLG